MIDIQSPEFNFVLYIAIFIGALLAFDGLRQLMSRSERPDEARNRRMRMVRKGAAPNEVLSILLDGQSRPGGRRSLYMRLRASMRQAGLPFGPFVLLVLMVLMALVLFALATAVIGPVLAGLASAVFAFGAPLIAVAALRKQRLSKLVNQLPEALDLMSRGLSVGHPLNVTVKSVATDMPDPIGSEFGIIEDQVSYGDDIVTAFSAFADRVDLEDARYLAVSVGIQHGTGGNLARVLQVLSKVIRDRATMRQKIKAISAEGRLSALILTLLPFTIFLMINITTPTFYGDVRSDPLFVPFAIAIVSLIGLQAVILNRLVNFKF